MERSVWLGLMRNVRAERYLFFPEYHLRQLTVLLLEAAAMSPGRWSALMTNPRNRNTAGLLYPVRKRVYSLMNYLDKLQECPAETDVYYLDNLETYIVPGGQYLVTWSGRWLSLWNVGLKNTDLDPLVAVTCVKDYRFPDERTETRVYGMTVQATADRRS